MFLPTVRNLWCWKPLAGRISKGDPSLEEEPVISGHFQGCSIQFLWVRRTDSGPCRSPTSCLSEVDRKYWIGGFLCLHQHLLPCLWVSASSFILSHDLSAPAILLTSQVIVCPRPLNYDPKEVFPWAAHHPAKPSMAPSHPRDLVSLVQGVSVFPALSIASFPL